MAKTAHRIGCAVMALVLPLALFADEPPGVLPAPGTTRYLLDKRGVLFRAEVLPSTEGLFVRDRQSGQVFAPGEFQAIFPEEYYELIRDSSPLQAGLLSIARLDAGERYIWNPDDSYSFFTSDRSVRATKIALLGLTSYFYYQALQSNERIRRSVEGVSSQAAVRRFRHDYRNATVSAGLTAFFFLTEFIVAYRLHGATPEGVDLGIQKREALEYREYLNQPRESSFDSTGVDRVEFSWHTEF